MALKSKKNVASPFEANPLSQKSLPTLPRKQILIFAVLLGVFLCALLNEHHHNMDDPYRAQQPDGSAVIDTGCELPQEPLQATVENDEPTQEAAGNVSDQTASSRRIDPEKKMIALTFDDGPTSRVTDRVVRVLKKYKVRATFFVVGESVLAYPDVVKRVYKAGMLIGTHTHTHKVLTQLTPDEMMDEIDRCIEAVRSACGFAPTLLRPPGGSINDTVQNTIHMPMIQWSVDTEDWITKDAKKIYQHLIDDTKDGSIVLLHDTIPATVEALKKAIPTLKKQGYQFVTVDELYDARGIELVAGTIHYACPIIKGSDQS